MKLRDVAVRFRARPLAPAVGLSLDTQLACLVELRRELTASYPSILSDRLIRIARRYGLDRFPEGFLVRGGLTDPGPSGARAQLRQIRRNEPGHDGTFHPLFSNEFYRLCNADVAATGTPPWVHYQVFGRAENRSPHPLIDVSYLAAWFDGTSRGGILDEYLLSPAAWTADPSPYVDCQKFLLHGNWDGETNPLIQIVGKRLTAPWIHQRLLLIDANSGTPDAARWSGIGYLLSRSTARSRLASVEAWSTGAHPDPVLPATITVVPGYFVGTEGRTLSAPSNAMVSPDATMLALPTEFLSVRSGATITASALRCIDRPLDHLELRLLVRTAAADTVIAPFDPVQDVALRALILSEARPDLRVLAHGVQVRVTAGVLSLAEDPIHSDAVRPWTATEQDATDVAFVLAGEESSLVRADSRITAAVRAGAAACILGAGSVTAWLPVLGDRPMIVCTAATLPAVLAVIDRDRVFRLDAPTGAPA